MFENLTPEKAIAFTQRSVALSYCLPLPSTATKFQVLRFKILRLATILSGVLLLLPLLYAIYLHRDSVLEATKAGCLFLPVSQIILQTFFCITQHDRLQWLIDRMKAYLKTSKSYERRVFERYVNKYSKFYGVSAMWFYGTAVIVVVGTLFISQSFPINAEYPFPTHYEPLRSIIFLHQAFVSGQLAAQVCLSVFSALLLLFATARFEISMIELRHADNIHALVQCLQKYYDARRYAQEVVNFVQYVVLIGIMVCTVSLILFGLFLIQRHPLTVQVQFLFMAGTALLEVFMCALPADNLMNISGNVMYGVYESMWYKRALKMQRNVLCALIPQKPITISIKCVVPVLSLNYYCSYILNTFSVFTALRATIDDGS